MYMLYPKDYIKCMKARIALECVCVWGGGGNLSTVSNAQRIAFQTAKEAEGLQNYVKLSPCCSTCVCEMQTVEF